MILCMLVLDQAMLRHQILHKEDSLCMHAPVSHIHELVDRGMAVKITIATNTVQIVSARMENHLWSAKRCFIIC